MSTFPRPCPLVSAPQSLPDLTGPCLLSGSCWHQCFPPTPLSFVPSLYSLKTGQPERTFPQAARSSEGRLRPGHSCPCPCPVGGWFGWFCSGPLVGPPHSSDADLPLFVAHTRRPVCGPDCRACAWIPGLPRVLRGPAAGALSRRSRAGVHLRVTDVNPLCSGCSDTGGRAPATLDAGPAAPSCPLKPSPWPAPAGLCAVSLGACTPSLLPRPFGGAPSAFSLSLPYVCSLARSVRIPAVLAACFFPPAAFPGIEMSSCLRSGALEGGGPHSEARPPLGVPAPSGSKLYYVRVTVRSCSVGAAQCGTRGPPARSPPSPPRAASSQVRVCNSAGGTSWARAYLHTCISGGFYFASHPHPLPSEHSGWSSLHLGLRVPALYEAGCCW